MDDRFDEDDAPLTTVARAHYERAARKAREEAEAEATDRS